MRLQNLLLFKLLCRCAEPGSAEADADADGAPVMHQTALKTVGLPSGLKPLVLEAALFLFLFFGKTCFLEY